MILRKTKETLWNYCIVALVLTIGTLLFPQTGVAHVNESSHNQSDNLLPGTGCVLECNEAQVCIDHCLNKVKHSMPVVGAAQSHGEVESAIPPFLYRDETKPQRQEVVLTSSDRAPPGLQLVKIVRRLE